MQEKRKRKGGRNEKENGLFMDCNRVNRFVVFNSFFKRNIVVFDAIYYDLSTKYNSRYFLSKKRERPSQLSKNMLDSFSSVPIFIVLGIAIAFTPKLKNII